MMERPRRICIAEVLAGTENIFLRDRTLSNTIGRMPLFENSGLPPVLKTLYPPIEPYDTGFLKVSSLHEIYYEVSGNPNGKPILFLHGGPGAGTTPKDRRFFDPKHYRIVLFDQRGAGQSRPHASLEENTTWDLVEDIERIREHLGISKWIIFGGSWGSTLSMVYAISHPSRVAGLILRGIFTLKSFELDFLYKEGANYLFPDAWEDFISLVPVEHRGNIIGYYHRLLTQGDESIMQAAASEWTRWEMTTNTLIPQPETVARASQDRFALAFARMEIHYFTNRGFLPTVRYIEEQIEKIRHIPAFMVHGRYDLVCPIRSAWELHKAWPEAEFQIVPNAGHTAQEPGTIHYLVDAADRFSGIRF